MPAQHALVEIRTAEHADAEHLLALWRVADAEPSATETAEAIDLLLSNDPESVLLAECDGAVGLWQAAGYNTQPGMIRLVRTLDDL